MKSSSRYGKLIGVTLGLWILVSIPMTFELYEYSRRSLSFSFPSLFAMQLMRDLPFALLIPLLYTITGRFSPRARALGAHLAAYLAYGASTTLTVTLFERFLVSDERAFFDAYVSLVPRRLGYAAIGYLVVYGAVRAVSYYQHSQRQRLENAQLERRLADARLQALSNQLRPHFLFNTLHAVSSLMEDDVKEARRMMALLGELLRISLERNEQEVRLAQELEALELYLSIERIRFQDRLRVEKDVAEPTLDGLVPHFVLQPIVENAIRHGVGALSTSGTVLIRTRAENGSLSLTVADDGPGCDGPPVEGVGLTNLRERLEQLYGGRSALVLENADPGFRATVTLPFHTEAENRR